jgi:hypothetical protein
VEVSYSGSGDSGDIDIIDLNEWDKEAEAVSEDKTILTHKRDKPRHSWRGRRAPP